MEAIGYYYVTNYKTLAAWHFPLGVGFAHAVGEIDTSRHHTILAKHVFVKH
jgi:hypothetical protein